MLNSAVFNTLFCIPYMVIANQAKGRKGFAAQDNELSNTRQ
jgi:hypothetical protein